MGGTDRGKPFFVGVTGQVLEALRENQDFFADFAWFDFEHLERKTEDFVDSVPGARVSPNFFTFWNVVPILGRTFAKDEATPLNGGFDLSADSVIVLSYSRRKSYHNSGRSTGVSGVSSGFFSSMITRLSRCAWRRRSP